MSPAPGILGMNMIRICYREHFGAFGPSLFDLRSVSLVLSSVIAAMQRFHQAATEAPKSSTGAARVRGRQTVCIPGGVMKLVASTCPGQFSGQCVLFEPLKAGLLPGLSCSPCFVQVVLGIVYVPVINIQD